MNQITTLFVSDLRGNTIFSDGEYMIPLYQRAFSWTEKEINQLIEDINSFEADHYYLGSLIVNRNVDGKFETIDGQQRLTALFLLLNYLEYHIEKGKLSFECREKSNYTLDSLAELSDDSNIEIQFANADKIEQSLIDGRKTIESKFLSDKIDTKEFKARLTKVQLFRIEVPPHTDLNRYFEIMNVRGEQLEQHDILKASLMGNLDESEQAAFAKVWDACRDMTGYVQMHFQKEFRESLFGGGWNWLKTANVFSYHFDKKSTNGQSISEILSKSEPIRIDDGEDESGNRVRFESIIDFPYFLLHVLRVFTKNEWKTAYCFPELDDDKKLLEIFQGVMNDAADKKAFAHGFILCLLKCRFLFDKYIIKREYKNDNNNGDWSLKELNVSGMKSRKKPFYKDTYFGKWSKIRNNLMLQSCLRVSYTSQKIMHWITRLLTWLYNDENISCLADCERVTEEIAQEPVRSFLSEANFRQGVNTPHIVLNYLDYLLWKGKRNESSDFVFEFRNSVEHWYPQHPSEQSFPKWDDVDRFGNLCIIQRNVNSKFSNLIPTSKKENNSLLIEKGSLKLRLMSEQTTDNAKWRETICEQHENEMLDLLRKACGVACGQEP